MYSTSFMSTTSERINRNNKRKDIFVGMFFIVIDGRIIEKKISQFVYHIFGYVYRWVIFHGYIGGGKGS